jgi:adenosine deaminase
LIESMPKVELHLHLEGAIPLEAMWELVQAHGGDPAVPSLDSLIETFHFTDFDHFIETWTWKLRFHRSYEDYTFIAEAVARDLARQHISYAEVFFSPTDVRGHGLQPGPLAMAVRRGFDRVPEVTLMLVPDLVRDTGPEVAVSTLAELVEVKNEAGIVGITIGGSEHAHPPAPFADVYRRARTAGLRTSAHAGEAAGPASVRDAIDVLEVDRIGHGIRSVEDPALVNRLVDSQIPLEVCPTSNLRTGVVSSWDEHPVRTLIDVGVNVTVNSDDPAMFDCDLAGEYLRLHQHFGYPLQTLTGLAGNAIGACWASRETKTRLRSQLDRWLSATDPDRAEEPG